MEEQNKWWGYRHVNGHWKVKRFFNNGEIEDAMQSDFVDEIVSPFCAEDREHAEQYIKDNYIGEHNV